MQLQRFVTRVAAVIGLALVLTGCQTPHVEEPEHSLPPGSTLRFQGTEAEIYDIACASLEAIGVTPEAGGAEQGYVRGKLAGSGVRTSGVIGVIWQASGPDMLLVWTDSRRRLRATPFADSHSRALLKELQTRIDAVHAEKAEAERLAREERRSQKSD